MDLFNLDSSLSHDFTEHDTSESGLQCFSSDFTILYSVYCITFVSLCPLPKKGHVKNYTRYNVCLPKRTLCLHVFTDIIYVSTEALLVLMSAPLCVVLSKAFVGLFFVYSLSGTHVPRCSAFQILEISGLNSHRSSLKTLSLIFFFW